MTKNKQKKIAEYRYRAATGNKVRSKSKKEPSFYKNARTARVTITVDSSLLEAIDDYVEQHHDTNRSIEFERALNMWMRWLQEQCDRACYQKMSAAQKKEHESWTAVATEAAKYIWQ